MNPALVATICGLIAALCWGTADFFAARASKKDTPELTAIFVGLIGAVFYTVLYLFLQSTDQWNISGILYAAIAGLFMGAGLLMFYRGLDEGPVSLVSPLGSAYPLVTALLIVVFLGGSLTGLQIGGILIIVAGITAASGFFEVKKSERKLTKGVSFALLTFLLWGIAFAFLGEAVGKIGWQKTTLVDIWFEFIAIATIVVGFSKTKISKEDIKLISNKFIAATALIQLLGLVIFDFGVTKSTSSAVITAVSSTYPALTVFLAMKHFEEKVPYVPLVGAFITVLGVVVLSIN